MTTARYSISTGLAGCYMPDNVSGPLIVTTRRGLMDAIRDEIEAQGWPKSMIGEVNAKRLWAHIKRHGSSSAHFRIQRGSYEIAFHGLTKAEADEMEAENDY